MKRPIGILHLTTLAAALWGAGCSQIEPADSVYLNARIYTVDQAKPWAEALAVSGDRFVFVGDVQEAQKYVGPSTLVTDLAGQMIMPGIHDAHIHYLLAGLHVEAYCELPPGASPEGMVEALKLCAEGQAQDDWIVAGFFYAEQFPDEQPNRSYLDAAFPDTPVYLIEFSEHHGLANSKALEIAGIDNSTAVPFGGGLPRDDAGELTGEMVESATWLIKQHIPPQPDAAIASAIRWASQRASQFGITSTQEAAATKPALLGLNAVDAAGELNQRVAAHLVLKSSMFGGATFDELEQLVTERQDYASPHVETDLVKMWIDGSPTPPYFTEAGYDDAAAQIDLDNLLIPAEELSATVTRLDGLGIKTKMHVAGAGAAHAALNAIAAARAANPESTLKHELGHTNLVIPSDLGRFKELNAVAEMSPSVWQIYGRTLGSPPRPAWQFKSIFDRGALITIGTDWPVTTDPNLFPALEGMVDRGDESIGLADAIAAMTINGAIALGWEAEQGSIENGKIANFIVLDRNLLEIDVADISETRVLMTVFEGRVVYSAEAEE